MQITSRPKSLSDEIIRHNILEVLTSEPEIDASDIEVSVEEGLVTLRGDVVDEDMKKEIEEKIRRLKGITRIQNKLQIGDSPFDPGLAETLF